MGFIENKDKLSSGTLIGSPSSLFGTIEWLRGTRQVWRWVSHSIPGLKQNTVPYILMDIIFGNEVVTT